MAGKGFVNTEGSQMVSFDAIFSSMYHTKQLNAWPSSSVSHVVIYSWLYVCPGEMEPFKDHLNTQGLSDNLQKQATAKAISAPCNTCLNCLNVYSYCLMVKMSLAVVWREAGFSQI